eukprot:TRINITY_DN2974_c0_g1_i1.p4 TRINITY_DN2974_c0_g1~~TRINITY_DN2974_c0_g1_i1.p4  ORF type:complete len:384 (-),score=158.34 TRINITY_DN2974_c0_g1_i1:1381-2532(-)
MQLNRDSKWSEAPSHLLKKEGERRYAELFTVKSPSNQFIVDITDFGGIIVRIQVGDDKGNLSDVVLGENSCSEYVKASTYFGATIGRVSNRIAGGKFKLEGNEHQLAVNNGPNHLHGGLEGFDKVWWNCSRFELIDPPKEISIQNSEISPEREEKIALLQFERTSKDGEEGYPGGVALTLRYYITSRAVVWELLAENLDEKSTLVNLTNHSYFNLEGGDSIIDDQVITLNADHYNPVDSDCLALDSLQEIEKSSFKGIHKEGVSFGSLFANFGDVDHSFHLVGKDATKMTLKGEESMTFVARVESKKSRRKISIYSNQPCVQLYTGNFLTEEIQSFGQKCRKHGAFCLETQLPPNSINRKEYAQSTVLTRGKTYQNLTAFVFQ